VGPTSIARVVALAADAAKTVVQPVAQRNPLGLMFGAFLVGGLLAWSRPWRRILTPALLVGLLPQLLSRIASNMPAQSWLAALTSLAQSLRAPNPIPANKISGQPVCSRTKSDSPHDSGF
jgi:hypothetical protein